MRKISSQGVLFVEVRRVPGAAAGGEFGFGDQDVDLAGVEVDADLVAGVEQGEAAADDGFGGDVEDGGAAGGAGLAAVAHGGEGFDALLAGVRRGAACSRLRREPG